MFRIAIELGVPIVPVVFRNVLDALPKGAFVVRPAVVEVEVLPPVETSSWTLDTLDDRIRDVRDCYIEILEESSNGR